MIHFYIRIVPILCLLWKWKKLFSFLSNFLKKSKSKSKFFFAVISVVSFKVTKQHKKIIIIPLEIFLETRATPWLSWHTIWIWIHVWFMLRWLKIRCEVNFHVIIDDDLGIYHRHIPRHDKDYSFLGFFHIFCVVEEVSQHRN